MKSHSFVFLLYNYMEMNMVDALMELNDISYELKSCIFKQRSDVLDYLMRHKATISGKGTVSHSIRTSVNKVSKKKPKWINNSSNLRYSTFKIGEFVFFVFANGRNEHPYVPDVSGLHQLSENKLNSASNSMFSVEAGIF